MSSLKGGDKLSGVLQRMAGAVTSAQSVKIGFMEDSTYPDGTPVAMVAAILDFGAPRAGIPPRPFFRNMIAAKSPEWPKAIAELLKANDYDAAKTLTQIGESVEGQLKQSIVDTNEPPLAESTLKKRGVGGMVYNPKDSSTFGAKPLIQSGLMYNSVHYKVQE